MYLEGSGCGDVGRGGVIEGIFEAETEVFDAIREPIDDRRGLVSGVPKRLCNRIRVNAGCFELTADSDDDVEDSG